MLKKYKMIVICAIASAVVQFFINDHNFSIKLLNVLFQFTASWLLAVTVNVFNKKYYTSDVVKWWMYIYGFMIAASLISHFIGL